MQSCDVWAPLHSVACEIDCISRHFCRQTWRKYHPGLMSGYRLLCSLKHKHLKHFHTLTYFMLFPDSPFHFDACMPQWLPSFGPRRRRGGTRERENKRDGKRNGADVAVMMIWVILNKPGLVDLLPSLILSPDPDWLGIWFSQTQSMEVAAAARRMIGGLWEDGVKGLSEHSWQSLAEHISTVSLSFWKRQKKQHKVKLSIHPLTSLTNTSEALWFIFHLKFAHQSLLMLLKLHSLIFKY